MEILTVAKSKVAGAIRSVAGKLEENSRDLEPEFLAYAQQVRRYTMTSIPRQYGLYQAVRYVVQNRIEGSFVECGVWRGGSSLLAALTFAGLADFRELWLYDTFAGMTPPTEHDAKAGSSAQQAAAYFKETQRSDHSDWCYASLEDVKGCLAKANYPDEKIRYVVGDVTQTIPGAAPEQIAILRLDTDFYDSTRHELEHLYQRLAPGGVLIIDDYGAWEGARKAVDEYFAAHERPPFLARVDETARIGQKPWLAAASAYTSSPQDSTEGSKRIASQR